MTTYVPEAHPHRRLHVNPWLVAVIVLAAALVALGTWVIVDNYTGGNTATENATSTLDEMYAASSTQDGPAIANLLTKDAVIWVDGNTVSGREAIVNATTTTPGLVIERIAPVTVQGDFASTYLDFTAPSAGVNHAVVLETVQLKNGKIFRIWDFGIGVTSPFTNTTAPTVSP
jgi:hypothetical protein